MPKNNDQTPATAVLEKLTTRVNQVLAADNAVKERDLVKAVDLLREAGFRALSKAVSDVLLADSRMKKIEFQAAMWRDRA